MVPLRDLLVHMKSKTKKILSEAMLTTRTLMILTGTEKEAADQTASEAARAEAEELHALDRAPLRLGVMCTIGPSRMVAFLEEIGRALGQESQQQRTR